MGLRRLARTGMDAAASVLNTATARTPSARVRPRRFVVMTEHENGAAVRQEKIDGLEPSYDASRTPRQVRWRSTVHIEDFMSRERLLAIAKKVAVWIPILLLVFIFVPQGWAKFSDSSGWARAFRIWGYPDWFRVTIGVVELSAVLFLLWPRTALIGAALIICVMLGGMGTHVVKEGGRHITSEIVPLVLATIVLLVKRRKPLNS